jgi:hypothetical protein
MERVLFSGGYKAQVLRQVWPGQEYLLRVPNQSALQRHKDYHRSALLMITVLASYAKQ